MKKHTTVLLHETVDGLNLKVGDTAVDATVGLGGHARELAHKIGKSGTLMVIDGDAESLALAKENIGDADAKLIFLNGNFRNIKTLAEEAGITKAQGIIFDLGWHSGQLESGKGLSFQTNEPLDMRLGIGAATTAADIIGNWHEDDLATLFREYGEERFAGRIARAIVEARRKKNITTTEDLANIVTSIVPRHSRIHPATRVFQALRIAVNDELEALKEGLMAAIDLLSPGGRVAVISFHSLEDRIVKNIFRTAEDDGRGVRVTKKPLAPSRAEQIANRRARSAKLRIFEKHA